MRVLIVDDSSFIRAYMRQQMTTLGHECVEAGNGLEGLEHLRTDGTFGLMLVDMNMPVMAGLECVRTVRKEGLGGAMKIMMVTTEADHHFIVEALETGADEFLMKPFTPESLVAKLMLLGIGPATDPGASSMRAADLRSTALDFRNNARAGA